MKNTAWLPRLRKKLHHARLRLSGAKRAAGMIGLSPDEAEIQYGNRSDVSVQSVFYQSAHRPVVPKHLPEDGDFPHTLSCFPDRLPDYDVTLLDIRNPAFTFQRHHLIDDRLRVIYEPGLRFEQLPVSRQLLGDCPPVRGTVVWLGNTLFCQYAHWLQKQLPLLLAYWETVGREQIDYYYIGDGDPAGFAVETLLQLGIGREQILHQPCRADRSLIAINRRAIEPGRFQRVGMRMDEASHHFLQSRLFPPPANDAPGRRLFVMRGEVSGRRERNLADVRAALEPLGFTFVTTQGLTVREEAALFAGADVIAAVHGAALHNLLFARPGTTVIEIFPYDWFEESNYVIASLSGCRYYYLIGEPLDDDPPARSVMERNRADVWIGPEKLQRLFRETQ